MNPTSETRGHHPRPLLDFQRYIFVGDLGVADIQPSEVRQPL